MNHLKSALSLFLLFVFFANHSYSQMPEKDIDSLVEHALKKFNVAGAAVVIVKDGKAIYKKGFGVKSIETKQLVDENTNFAIGSNSKAFTTVALAILVEEGKLSWTDKVKAHIPEFKMYNDYVTENFNIQDLLTHRSGLGLGAGDLMLFPDGSDFTIKDVVSNFQHFKPVSAFRTQFDYDNQLYLVAGEVIARASGMSWEDFIQKRIMVPLEMKDSYSSLAGMKEKDNLSSAHSSQAGVIKKIGTFGDMMNGAAGGIFSNANDMSKWMLAHLNKGKYGPTLQSQLFSRNSQREMWRLHTVEDANPNPRYNSHFRGYGLGWGISDIKGNLNVSHTGGVPGMLSMVTMIPDLNLGITVLTNTESGGAGVFTGVSQTIIDSYLGLDNIGWIEKYYAIINSEKNTEEDVVKKVWETVKAGRKTNIKKEDFIGIYQDKWFGKIEIFLKDGQLWFKSYRSPKLTGQMQFYKANTFAIKWEYQDMNCDAFAMFSLDEEGKAQSIKMKGISPGIDFSFDFHDLDLLRIKP